MLGTAVFSSSYLIILEPFSWRCSFLLDRQEWLLMFPGHSWTEQQPPLDWKKTKHIRALNGGCIQKANQSLYNLIVLASSTTVPSSSFHPEALFLVYCIPCLQSAGPGAVQHLVAAVTRRQRHRHRSATVVAELWKCFPKTRSRPHLISHHAQQPAPCSEYVLLLGAQMVEGCAGDAQILNNRKVSSNWCCLRVGETDDTEHTATTTKSSRRSIWRFTWLKE